MSRNRDDTNFKSLTFSTPVEVDNNDDMTSENLVLNENPRVVFIEPFYGGSHKQLMDLLIQNVQPHTFVHMKPKKWHWRARCGALALSTIMPRVTTETVLFCSSVLNLAELLGLRPDLLSLKKIVYFHENQLVYPIRIIKERDVQFAYNQITTCIAADVVLFNSHFNKDSFLSNIKSIVKLLPDYRPKNLKQQIESKCKVIYFPVAFPKIISGCNSNSPPLHVVWPHRWEFDKGPVNFLNVLFKLKEDGSQFTVSLLGETFEDVPEIFGRAREVLRDEILHFGYVPEKADYYRVLSSGHVVVSTASHEFFGVAVLVFNI